MVQHLWLMSISIVYDNQVPFSLIRFNELSDIIIKNYLTLLVFHLKDLYVFYTYHEANNSKFKFLLPITIIPPLIFKLFYGI